MARKIDPTPADLKHMADRVREFADHIEQGDKVVSINMAWTRTPIDNAVFTFEIETVNLDPVTVWPSEYPSG